MARKTRAVTASAKKSALSSALKQRRVTITTGQKRAISQGHIVASRVR